MDKAKIKAALLAAAGNPESGVIADLVDTMAQAVIDIDKPEVKSYSPVEETRVVKVTEKR
jgi:hypothetical protein